MWRIKGEGGERYLLCAFSNQLPRAYRYILYSRKKGGPNSKTKVAPFRPPPLSYPLFAEQIASRLYIIRVTSGGGFVRRASAQTSCADIVIYVLFNEILYLLHFYWSCTLYSLVHYAKRQVINMRVVCLTFCKTFGWEAIFSGGFLSLAFFREETFLFW